MFKIIAIIMGALLAGLLIFAATRPDTFRVQRQVSIKASPEKIFPRINDFHQRGSWLPYEKLDPAMNRAYSGAEIGRGAVYAWAGAGKAGAGRMEILESSPASKVTIQLDFTKPFEARNTAEFTLQAQGDTTNVTWAMYGPSPYIAKLMGVFFNMDRMIGRDFEVGLANMKTVAEK